MFAEKIEDNEKQEIKDAMEYTVVSLVWANKKELFWVPHNNHFMVISGEEDTTENFNDIKQAIEYYNSVKE